MIDPGDGFGPLVVTSVGKTFESSSSKLLRALHDINLRFEPSEFVSLIGPSGCGKTTLLNIIAGLESPSEGEVRLGDISIKRPSPKYTMVFQQFALFPWMTVAKNVESGLRFTKVPKETRKEVVHRVLETVDLLNFAKLYPKELSGGMKQRVAIARAYALEPAVLLMDEPFGALDAQTRVQLQQDLLYTWSRAQRTVVFVTHDVDEAVFLSNRVVVMSRYPGEVHRQFDVNLPYPRTQEVRTSNEFFTLRSQVWESVYSVGEGSQSASWASS